MWTVYPFYVFIIFSLFVLCCWHCLELTASERKWGLQSHEESGSQAPDAEVTWSVPFLWRFHIYKYRNKLQFNPQTSLLVPHTHILLLHSAPLTVCAEGGWMYFRVSSASLLRRESPLCFPPLAQKPFLCRQTVWTKPLSAAGDLYGDRMTALGVVEGPVSGGWVGTITWWHSCF